MENVVLYVNPTIVGEKLELGNEELKALTKKVKECLSSDEKKCHLGFGLSIGEFCFYTECKTRECFPG